MSLTRHLLHLLVDFGGKFWRNFVLLSLGAVAIYKYAPSPEDSAFSRMIAHYKTPSDVWRAININNLLVSADSQEKTLVIADAKMPRVHRYRFPQCVWSHLNSWRDRMAGFRCTDALAGLSDRLNSTRHFCSLSGPVWT